MSTAITPSEVLWEESTWGHTRDASHLPAQREDATAGSSPQKARSKQRPRPRGAHILQRAVPQKQHSHLTLPHRHSPCSLFYGMNTCAGRRNRDYVVWGPPTEWASHFPCHFTQLTFRCYTSNIQRLKRLPLIICCLVLNERKTNEINRNVLLPKKKYRINLWLM